MKEEECVEVKEQKNYITLDIIKESNSIQRLDTEGIIYLVTLDDKYLITKRVGKCDYKKCKNACCKFCSVGYNHEYYEGFGEKSKIGNHIILKKKCKFIDKNGTCKKWGQKQGKVDYSNGKDGILKGFPRACDQFPYLSDEVYHEVMDVCTFRYEIIMTIPNLRDKTIQEMILNFKEYL